MTGRTFTAIVLAQDWKAGGHPIPGAWLHTLGIALGAVLGLGFLALLLRGWLRRRWYRARDVLGEEDLRAVRAALVAAELRTSGEILPVVLERSDRHPGACWLAAFVCVLVGSAGLAPWLPWELPAWLLVVQLGLGAMGYGCARWLPDFQRFFLSEARASEMAEEQAFQEFHRHELFRTKARTGVLLFLSLLERRAVVLADIGIHDKVGAEAWKRTNERMLAGVRRGSLREGLVAGIESAGELLAEHYPVGEGDRNEIPDRVIVRRE